MKSPDNVKRFPILIPNDFHRAENLDLPICECCGTTSKDSKMIRTSAVIIRDNYDSSIESEYQIKAKEEIPINLCYLCFDGLTNTKYFHIPTHIKSIWEKRHKT